MIRGVEMFVSRSGAARLGSLLLALMALFCSPLAPASAQSAQTRVALIIANSAYLSVPALPNPVADGRLVAKSLKSSGFQTVILLENQDRIGMERALRDFAAAAERADVAMIYYAGHGIEANGENYLIPVDARLANDRDLEIESVKLSTLVRMAEGAKRLRIIVIDACRTPPSGMKRVASSRSISRGLAPIEPEGDSLVVYSAKAGTTAADGSGQNSPFAASLARRIVQPGRELNILFRLVRDDVMKETKGVQEPFTYGSLSSEEFFFIPATKGSSVGIDMEAEAWGLCRDSVTRSPCENYLKAYAKSGRFTALATTRMNDLSSAPAPIAAAVRPAAPIALETANALGINVRANADWSGIRVESVSSSGIAYGQLLSGDLIIAVNSNGLQRDVPAGEQLDAAMAGGRVKLLVKRGPTSTLVILRK